MPRAEVTTTRQAVRSRNEETDRREFVPFLTKVMLAASQREVKGADVEVRALRQQAKALSKSAEPLTLSRARVIWTNSSLS